MEIYEYDNDNNDQIDLGSTLNPQNHNQNNENKDNNKK